MLDGRILLVFVILSICSSAVFAGITEIMYNPIGGDNHKEYVEVIFDGEHFMEGWIVKDLSSSDLLIFVNGSENSKINIIVEEGYEADYFDAVDLDKVGVYSAGPAIGNGLSNKGDSVYLYDLDGSLVASAVYSDDLGNGNGNAICFFEDGSYYSCAPSPGVGGFSEDEITYVEEGADEIFGEYVKEEEKLNESDEGFIRIEYVDYGSGRPCENLNVGVAFWNNRNWKEEIHAYVLGIGVNSTLKLNPHKGQMVDLPVVTCNGLEEPLEGEYALVVEGFGKEDMRIVRIGGLNELEYEKQDIIMESNIKGHHEGISSFDKTDIDVIAPFEGKNSDLLANVAFYLMYLVGGLGVYYVMFRI
tara:strand:- start:11907 stop:12986 length:1080 start_codon:yes stop_codon:yes gene_type:complete